VRALIKELGHTTTILLSTHLLNEVEMTCSRVLILERGRIVAADATENLERLLSLDGQVVAELAAGAAELQEAFRDIPEIERVDISPLDGTWSRLALTPRDGVDLRAYVFDVASQNGWKLRELTRNRHSLEDIFVHLTRGRREDEQH
jgi:ABC-2 type transport system ATP-binding protein